MLTLIVVLQLFASSAQTIAPIDDSVKRFKPIYWWQDPKPVCKCTKDYSPVRCANNQVYDNKCLANCDGQFRCEEEKLCVCTMHYAPVKCSNGVTYSNECMAGCAAQRSCERTTTTLEPIKMELTSTDLAAV
eukprot:TRINITY_DN104425_c0_g1_i2.p4 TRINITY_DN104425_c0_g1~~TRINITY_DN104425_c0_g1_i2.p4  ORF type:complete len:132 (+),score=5.87 TRINITY_DN104425_c0_g1_i2:247-642(+)